MTELYKIAVHLGMTSNAPALLATLSKHFLGLHVDVKKLEGGLSRLHAVLGGVAMVAASATMVTAFKKMTDAASELNHQLASTATLSSNPLMSAALRNQALVVARSTSSSVHGTSLDRNVKLFNESYSMFGADNAQKMNAPLARFGMVLGGIYGNYNKADEELYSMVKSGDLLGKFIDEKSHNLDTQKLLGFLDIAAKIAAATGGKVGPAQFFQMAQQGNAAIKRMDDDGLMAMAMAAQGMGGFRAGTAAQAMFRQFAGGKMTAATANELHRLGLVGDFHTLRGGSVEFEQGGLDTAWTKAVTKDPLSAMKILTDAMHAHGISGDDAENKELFKIMGTNTVTRLIGDFMTNLLQMTPERLRITGAQSIDQQDITRNAQDYDRNVENLTAAWHNFMQEIGNPLTTVAIGYLQTMTPIIDSWSHTISQMDPKHIEAIGNSILIMSGAFAGAGMATLFAAIGPAGWLIIGIGAVSAALSTINLDDWIGETGKLVLMRKGIEDTFHGWIQNMIDEVKTWPSRLSASVIEFGNAIVEMFKNFFGKFGNNGQGGVESPMSYDGGGGLLKYMSYTTGGGYGVGSMAGGGSWNGSLLSTSKGWSVAGGSPSERAAFIMKTAAGLGIDPKTALRVAQSEGFYGFVGDHGLSHGDFQLYSGGGLGNAFRAATGLNPYDPKNWREMDQFALQDAARHGWGAFHGAARVGIGNWQGIDRMQRAKGAIPYRNDKPVHVHVPVHLDGKIIAKVVTKHQVAAATMPLGIHGGPDDFGSFVGPGSTFQPS